MLMQLGQQCMHSVADATRRASRMHLVCASQLQDIIKYTRLLPDDVNLNHLAVLGESHGARGAAQSSVQGRAVQPSHLCASAPPFLPPLARQ